MRYSIQDVLAFVAFTAMFLGFSLAEPMGVIWALAIFSVASVVGIVLCMETVVHFAKAIYGVVHDKSLRPLLACFEWKRALTDIAIALLLIVSVVTANYAITEGTQLNMLLFICPCFALYVCWRWFTHGPE